MKSIPARLLSVILLAGATASATDTAAPQLVSIAIAPGAVDISTSSQTVTVTLHITDDESGVAYANIFLYNPADHFVVSGYLSDVQRTSGTHLDGIYSVTVTIPRYAQAGTWRIDTLLRDSAQHERQIGPGNEPYPVAADALFTVANTGTMDTAPPSLQAFTVSPALVFTVGSAAQVTATIHCTEDLSGFKYGFVYVYDPVGNFHGELLVYFQDTQRTSGDAFDGTYTVPITMPQGSAPGTWGLSIYLQDEVGNSSYQSGGNFTVSNNPPHSLGNALDATQFVWTTGNPGWGHQTAETHDGVDAAASGTTGDSEQATMQTTVTGPGTLSFFWRVDSEEFSDVLSVAVPDTAETYEISGNTAWAAESVTIPAGAHTVIWRYAKDGSGAQGEDRGWVDQVRFTGDSDTLPPVLQALRVSPSPVDVSSGPQTVTFTIEASDELLGISNGELRIIRPSNTNFATLFFDSNQRVSGDALYGTYELTAEIPDTEEWGTWRVEVDLIEESTANTRSYGAGNDPFPNPGEEIFTVSDGSTTDHEAPLVQTIGTAPAPVEVTSGAATLTVTVGITDDNSGFSTGRIRVYTPAGAWAGSADFDAVNRISGDPFDGIYTVPVTIPQGSAPGTWNLYVYLRDEAGNPRYQPGGTFTVSNNPPHSLGNALDAAQFGWTTGNPGWGHQTAETHDGVDAASSGITGDSQESTMQTTVTGPGTLYFQWRVDSEEFADILTVSVPDTAETYEISGNTAWGEEWVTIPAGAHTVIWRYAKDGSDAQGEDRGWVDQVRFVGDSDTSPPVLQALRISPSPVNVWSGPQTVTFTLEASDDNLGISNGELRIIRPSNTTFATLSFDSNQRMSGDGLFGTYEVAVEIPETEEWGDWRVEVDLIEEATANTRSYGPANDPFPNPGEEIFAVSDGTTGDHQAPLVQSISTAPGTVDVTTAAATLSVTVHITDDHSGFFEGSISVYTPAGAWTGSTYFTDGNRISGDAFDGVYEIEIAVPLYGPPGTWKTGCYLRDNAGNEREYPYNISFPTPGDGEFTVTNTGLADTTAPVLNSIDITPATVDVSASAATITVTVSITDDLSGFRDRYLFFYEPGDIYSGYVFAAIDDSHRISGDELNGIYQVQVPIPQGSTAGPWQIRVFLRDKTGGTQFYGPGAAAYPEPGDGGFTVASTPPSLYQSFVQTHNLTGDDALPSADPDHDGVNNATELMHGTNPANAASAGAGLITVTRDAGFLYLNFTIDPALTVSAAGGFLELRDGGGGAPFRLTGQTQAGPGTAWSNVLPAPISASNYRIGLPITGGSSGFARLYFENP
jgi:hypothetical protein